MSAGGTVLVHPRPDRDDRPADGAHSWPSRWLTAAIHGYRAARSGRPTGCRYLPSCSQYALEAIDRHGAAAGGWLALKRLARCRPWGGHGVDPVPDRRAPCSDH